MPVSTSATPMGLLRHHRRGRRSEPANLGVPDNRPLADFAPTIILKSKDFATEITIFNAREHRLVTEPAIS
jgi:DNA-damage-inducible protein D